MTTTEADDLSRELAKVMDSSPDWETHLFARRLLESEWMKAHDARVIGHATKVADLVRLEREADAATFAWNDWGDVNDANARDSLLHQADKIRTELNS